MKQLHVLCTSFLISLFILQPLFSQTGSPVPSDQRDSARAYIHSLTLDQHFWRPSGDSVRRELNRLLLHVAEPFDSVRTRLGSYDFRSIEAEVETIPLYDSTRLRWLNDSTFIIDSVGWNLDLLQKEVIRYEYPVDFSTLAFSDTLLDENGMLDSTLFLADTITELQIDTTALESLGIPLHRFTGGRILPPVREPYPRGSEYMTPDSAYIVHTDTLRRLVAPPGSPFHVLRNRQQLDSLQAAMLILLDYTETRDSVQLLINDMHGRSLSVWLTKRPDTPRRFWVKNFRNDSITLWIGNPSKRELSLVLDDEIEVNRISKVPLPYLPVELRIPDPSLAEVSLLKADPVYWVNEFSSAFSLNQTLLVNWSKGGESSLATIADLSGGSTYHNKDANVEWINTGRIKYGTLVTSEKGLRKNEDLVELNSKFNMNASGKIGFSATFYMKSQLAKGFAYPNDSVAVSKFLNPASLTLGLGADYKPWKNTSINMAPLSYKNTFVLDTANIDQTTHGVDAGKRARQEMGAQLVISHKMVILEDMNISTKLRLFSNYLNNPENVDVDWELMMDKKISWFFTVRFNLHMIYDDDVRFPVLDADDQPVLNPDGSAKKVPKTQLKQFLGLSLLFRF